MTEFIEQPAFDIGRRLEVRGSDAWFVVLKPTDADPSALETFVADLSAVLEQPVRIVDGTAPSVNRIRTELKARETDPVLIACWNDADADLWSSLDINRSGVARPGR